MGSNKHVKQPYEKFFKSFFFGSEFNDIIHEHRTIQAIRGLCSELNVDFYYRTHYLNRIENESIKDKPNIPARDGHPGSAQQEFYYNSFLNMVNENN